MKKYPIDYKKYILDNVGSDKYRNHFVSKDDALLDVLQDGRFACAKFVSEILKKFKMIKRIHSTVKASCKDMIIFGWREIELKDMKRGDVLVWERNKTGNLHIGFYVGRYRAVSNSSQKRIIWKHHYKYRGKRKIVKVLTLLSHDVA